MQLWQQSPAFHQLERRLKLRMGFSVKAWMAILAVRYIFQLGNVGGNNIIGIEMIAPYGNDWISAGPMLIVFSFEFYFSKEMMIIGSMHMRIV